VSAARITKVGVVGLGAMGLPMANTLAGAGFAVKGFDVDVERRKLFAPSVDSLEALADVEAVVLSLPNDAVVASVVGALARALTAPLLIDTSTVSPVTSRRLAGDLAAVGGAYVDAPVSGGMAGAAAGTLLTMVGGDLSPVERAMPVLDALSRKVVRCGGPGTGAVVKLANNMLCAGHLLLAGEALRIAEAGDVGTDALLEALNAGSGRSGVTELNLPKWILSGAYDSGFTLGLMAKDVTLAAKLAGAGELASEIAERWQAAAEEMGGTSDFNRIVERPT